MNRILSAPILAMEHESPARFDRAAVKHRPVRRLAGVDAELLEQSPNADASALVADADTHRAVLIMDAHDNDGAFEPRITDARHGQQQFA